MSRVLEWLMSLWEEVSADPILLIMAMGFTGVMVVAVLT